MGLFRKWRFSHNTNGHKVAYWFVVFIYVALCTFLNQPTFQAFAGDVYYFGLGLALCMSIIEMKLAQNTGKALALKQRLKASYSFVIGLGLVGYMVSKQANIGYGLIILLVYFIGILFSNAHALEVEKNRLPRLIAYLTKVDTHLKVKKVRLNHNLERAKEKLQVLGKAKVNAKIQNVQKQLNTNQATLIKNRQAKESELKAIENLELEVIAEIRRGYGDYGQVA